MKTCVLLSIVRPHRRSTLRCKEESIHARFKNFQAFLDITTPIYSQTTSLPDISFAGSAGILYASAFGSNLWGRMKSTNVPTGAARPMPFLARYWRIPSHVGTEGQAGVHKYACEVHVAMRAFKPVS